MGGALRLFLATCAKKSKTDRKVAWRTGPTSPFLMLPSELRLKIYEYLLPSGTVWSTGLYDSKRCNSLAILFTSRQIYREALDVLYSQMTTAFGIYSYPAMFDFAKFLSNRNMGTPDQRAPMACHGAWCKNSLNRIKHVKLQIDWLGYERYNTALRRGARDWVSLTAANDANIAELVKSICTTLSRLPQPQTVAISWRSIGLSGNGSPPEHKFPIILRPLKLVRPANSGTAKGFSIVYSIWSYKYIGPEARSPPTSEILRHGMLTLRRKSPMSARELENR